MTLRSGPPCAVVIEANLSVANVIDVALTTAGYDVVLTTSHRAAALQVAARPSIELIAACIPAPDDDHEGAYLSAIQKVRDQRIPLVLMVMDEDDDAPSAPEWAVRLKKPFSRDELLTAVILAGTRARSHAVLA